MSVLKTFNIALDTKKALYGDRITLVESDTGNRFVITLTDDGDPVNLTGCRVAVVFSGAMGTAMQTSWSGTGQVTIGGDDDNEITVDVLPASYANGLVTCEIQVYSGESYTTLVTSAAFTFNGRKPIVDENTLDSSTEYPILVELINQVEGLTTREQSDWEQTDDTQGNYIRNKPVVNVDFASAAHASRHLIGGADALNAMPYDSVSSNLLINGGFDVWQRGTSFSAIGYSADRWLIDFNGTGATRAITRQAFTVGQTDVPNNPTYYLRFNQSVAGSGGVYNVFIQRIEDVSRLSGKTVTLSFYAKADSARNIPTEVYQHFGSGGSAAVYCGGATHSLTTAWQLCTLTVTFPSISGKTIGDSNFSSINFVMPINTTFTIDIANVQLSPAALPFVPRSFADELRLCQRYYIASGGSIDGRMLFYGTNSMEFFIPLPVTMRTNPTLVGTANANYLIYSTAAAEQSGFFFTATLSSAGATIAATKNSHGLTDGFFRIRSGLDAEL